MGEELWPYETRRPVEWLAVFVAIYGFVPPMAWGRHYASPPDVYHNGQVNITRHSWAEGLTIAQMGHPEWKQCPECENSYPEVDYYWHKNAQGKHGRQSLCKACRRAREQKRYQARIMQGDG